MKVSIDERYGVIVVDPPWPMKKIVRRCAPNQTEDLDYPTMTVEQIKNLNLPCKRTGCHLWLWTTHRFLPAAFDVLRAWEARYVCTFTWKKNGGFQPFNLPMYDCEFALYARIGKPRKFKTQKNFRTTIDAARGRHSEKPEEFYAMIRRVTEGKRLDMFNRRKIAGFAGWGNEAK